MRSTSSRAMIVFLFSMTTSVVLGAPLVLAQTSLSPEQPSPQIRESMATTTQNIQQAVPPPSTGNTSGGGFSNYVNGLPTIFTLPDGTRVDVSIPEDTTAQDATLLRTQPSTPKAFEKVVFTVENFATKLSEDRITWTVDGRIVQDQIGGDTITATMGKIGEALNVRVSIDSRKIGKRLTKETTLMAGDVAVLWEANTYIPPFYKGKPLPSYKSTIKLVPLPTMIAGGRAIPPENLLYSWNRNYRNIKELSGYGKRFSVLEAGGGTQEERLLLTVSHPETGAVTARNITIKMATPKLLLYEGSPLQGVRYERTLDKELFLREQEVTIKGEPYYFSNEDLLVGTLPITWKQNGKVIPSLYNTIVLRRPSERGTSRIDVALSNSARVLQSARNGLNVTYTGE